MTADHSLSLSFWQRYRDRLVPAALVLIALTVRLIYIVQIDSSPTSRQPIMDEQYHVLLADQINSGNLPDEPYYRAPLYPYLLAFLLKVTDRSYFGVRLIQAFLGSLIPIFVYLFGLRLFNRRIAYIAGLIAALWPTFIYYDASLLITSTMTWLTCLLVLQLLRCNDNPERVGRFILAGLFLGVAGLARPNILLLGPALIIWIWLIIRPKLGPRAALLRFALIGLVSFAVILPVTVRNYAVADDPVFIAWQGGYNFFIGNNRLSNGWSATVSGFDVTWQGGYEESIAFAEQAEGRTLKRSEVSDFWYKAALNEIRSDLSGYVALLFKKIRLFINGYEIPNNQNIYLSRELSSVMKPLLFSGVLFFPYGLLAPLALIGLAVSLTQWRRFLLVYLTIGAYLITLLLFFVCARFRQPLLPFMILFAVYGGTRIVHFFRKREYKNLALALFMLLLLLVESNHEMTGLSETNLAAQNQFVIGNAYLAENNLSSAETHYKKATELDPGFADPLNNLGLIATRRNRIDDAIVYYERAIRANPDYVEAYINLASSQMEKGRPDQAVTILEQAAGRSPLNDMVFLNLGIALAETGRTDESIKTLKRCLQLNPHNETAKSVLQQVKQLRAP